MRPDELHGTSGRRRIRDAGVLAVLLALSASGCSDLLGLGGDRVDEAFDRWRSARPENYYFTFRYTCFCPGTRPVVITVEGDSVVQVSRVDEDDPPPGPTSTYFTVEGLFERIREWRARDPYRERLEFHDRMGYPVDVFIDFERNVADEEQGFRISELRALERLEE